MTADLKKIIEALEVLAERLGMLASAKPLSALPTIPQLDQLKDAYNAALLMRNNEEAERIHIQIMLLGASNAE